MAREDMGQALVALRDEDLRGRIAGGDRGAAEQWSLTDEEWAMLQGAAEDYPADVLEEEDDEEVEGFFLQSSLSERGIIVVGGLPETNRFRAASLYSVGSFKSQPL